MKVKVSTNISLGMHDPIYNVSDCA